jgi:hypothetical protein
VDFSQLGVSASKLQDTTRRALPSSGSLHNSFFGEVYGVRGPRMSGILLLIAQKTDSAGWLRILLP